MTETGVHYRWWFGLALLGTVATALSAVFGSVIWAVVLGVGSVTLLIRGIRARTLARTPEAATTRFLDPGAVAYVVLAIALVVYGITLLAGITHPHEGSPIVLGVLSFAAAAAFMFVALVGLGVVHPPSRMDRRS